MDLTRRRFLEGIAAAGGASLVYEAPFLTHSERSL
jgi:hypothetical protein